MGLLFRRTAPEDVNATQLVKDLRRIMTDNHRCFGCGREHDCSIHGCAIMRDAAAWIEHRARRFDEVYDRCLELEAKNESLQSGYDAMARDLQARTEQVRRLQDENERLHKENFWLTNGGTSG